MKTPVDHEVVNKTKQGMGTILKASDPVVKFFHQKISAISYDPHPTRSRLIMGSKVGAFAFIGGIVTAISWMRRKG